MSSSWGRGQVEPLAALAAVFAVGVGLTLYVGALDTTLSRLTSDREVAPAAADRTAAEASSFGAVEPPIEGSVAAARPTGYELNATLRTKGAEWTGGPPTPRETGCEQRDVSVRVAPGRIRPGGLEVCVWPAR